MNHTALSIKKPLSSLAISMGIETWEELLKYVRLLPYGRNSNRTDFSLVLTEKKGSCSSKHGLLKSIADENKLTDVKLVLAIYKMNRANTPGIGSLIENEGLNSIPEAHCYLKIGDSREDFTTTSSSFERFKNELLMEKEINSSQVIQYKIDFHQNFFKKWLKENYSPHDFEQLWDIREKCINNLSHSLP